MRRQASSSSSAATPQVRPKMPQELCLAESIVSNAVVPVLRILRTTDVLVLCARVFPLDIAMTLDAAEQTKNRDYTRLNLYQYPCVCLNTSRTARSRNAAALPKSSRRARRRHSPHTIAAGQSAEPARPTLHVCRRFASRLSLCTCRKTAQRLPKPGALDLRPAERTGVC